MSNSETIVPKCQSRLTSCSFAGNILVLETTNNRGGDPVARAQTAIASCVEAAHSSQFQSELGQAILAANENCYFRAAHALAELAAHDAERP